MSEGSFSKATESLEPKERTLPYNSCDRLLKDELWASSEIEGHRASDRPLSSRWLLSGKGEEIEVCDRLLKGQMLTLRTIEEAEISDRQLNQSNQ